MHTRVVALAVLVLIAVVAELQLRDRRPDGRGDRDPEGINGFTGIRGII